FQAEDGIRYFHVTGVQTCALPILKPLKILIMLKKAALFLLVMTFGVSGTLITAEAQILKGFGKKLEKKIEDRIERKADKQVDKRSEERRVGKEEREREEKKQKKKK